MTQIKTSSEWMTTTDATKFLGISTKTMARMIRDGEVATRPHPWDRRKKLVRVADLMHLKAEADRIAA